MENKKLLMFGIFLLIGIFSVVVFSENSSAVGEVSVCCEKTDQGAWCQEVSDESDCNPSYRSAPTSCESTSYCKLGTCVNTLEGLCMENVPQKVCETPVGGVAAGVWYDSVSDELNQCQLGCCLVGGQASFTTQTRCKQLSSTYGLETNYRTDIRSESQCILSATPGIKGACVFEEEFQNTCRFLTKGECQDLENSGVGDIEFNPGFLCSASKLGTNCGPSKKTTLLDGRDEVYFIDTCGNPANIYDFNLQADPEYWERIVPKDFSCGVGDANARSATCGNCDYFLGSTGKLYDRAEDGTPAPNYGDYICRDLSCEDEDGEEKEHGETWCISSASSDSYQNSPGSRDFRKVCYNGEVTIEPCADYRQEICVSGEIETRKGTFSTAACRANMWQDCVAQDDNRTCENFGARDCTWVSGDRFDGEEFYDEEEKMGRCVPTNPPGFDFWEEETDGEALCAQISETCQVKFERGIGGFVGDVAEGLAGGVDEEWRCVENCECLGLTDAKSGESSLRENARIDEDNDWLVDLNNICLALGDCGVSENHIGESGYYEDWEDLVTVTGRGDE